MKSHDSMISTGNFGKATVLTKDFLDSLNETEKSHVFIQKVSKNVDYVSTSRPFTIDTLKDMKI